MRKLREKASWRRRSGVVWKPGQLGVPREPRFGTLWQSVWQNDGGEDIPLSAEGRWRYHLLVGAIVFVGIVAILLVR
jgi:hypothetical protein